VRELDVDALGDTVDRLYRAAWALTGDRHEAEDLVQDTYAKVLARPRTLRGDDLAYLLRALDNTHRSRFRRRRRRPAEVPLDTDHATRAPGPEEAYVVTELFQVIAQLPEDQRAAVIAVDVTGLSYAEAAAALDVKEATLTTRLHRARRRVAELLDPEKGVPLRASGPQTIRTAPSRGPK
jgi:RNA polymerase sigma-70 factor (ECF subfamily)